MALNINTTQTPRYEVPDGNTESVMTGLCGVFVCEAESCELSVVLNMLL